VLVARWLFIGNRFMTAARIYREDLTRVTTSHNRLDLSQSKRIRHRLGAKINAKRRSSTYEALGQILVDHSRVRRVPTPIAPCHPAPPCSA
jgi:hypothetical protein